MKTRSLPLLFLLAALSSHAQSFVGTNSPGQTTNFTFTLAAGATNFSLVVSNSATAYSWLFLTNGSTTPTATGYEFTSRLAGLTNQINLEAPEFTTGNYSLLVSTPAASTLQSFKVVLTTNLTNLRTASYPVSKPLVFSTTGFLTNSGSGQWQYFQVDVPSNLLTGWRVVVSSTNSTPPSLYIQRGQVPTTGNYAYATAGSSFGTVTVDTLTLGTNLSTNGTYFIGVYLPSGVASSAYYTLGAELASVTTLAWDPGTTQAGTQVYNNQSTTGGDYFFAITTQTTADGVWRNALNVQSGQASLYLLQGNLPSTGSSSFSSTLAGSNGFVLSQGGQFSPGQNWYLLVHATPNAQWNLVTGEAFVNQLPALATDASSGTNVTMGAEGMAFFKTTVPMGTLAWRLGLNGLANQLYVKSTLAPTPYNTSTYDLTQPGQMLVVPTYLKSGSQYFAGVVGSPGLLVTLDSRQQPVTTVPFNSTTPLTVTGYGYTTFLVQVPIQQIAWQINVTPTSGYAAVAVNLGSVPNEFVNAAFSEAPAGVGDSISLVPPPSSAGAGSPGLSSGTWYITVYGTAPYTCTLFNGNPVITTVNYVFNITNDAPNRVGWRFYQILNSDLEQVDSLGWELDLSNAIPGAEIAIRRNAVPGAWNYRSDPYDYYPYYTTGYSDLSSTLGFLQQPGHQADVWYIGVYTPTTALGSFVLTGSQLVANPVSFDGVGNVTNLVNQPSSKWDYFVYTVPANALGWDLRITNVTSGDPQMYVCRDQLPSTSPAGSVYWVNHSWPSGYQWYPSSDWTGYPYDPNGQDENGWIMAVGMGNPLEAGTYYVGIVNTSGSTPMSYSLASRGIGIIGSGFSIPVTPLNFTNGPTITSTQIPRNADYYSVVVPTNTSSWRLELDTNIGNVELVINETTVPSSTPTGYPPYDVYGGLAMNRVGDQQYLMMPDSGATNIRAGTYYLAVVSEGQNPVSSTIGSNSSTYTVGSYGSLTITNIGTVDPSGNTDLLETNGLSKAGQISAYSFSVPLNTLSLEIFLTNKTGNPNMTLLTGNQLPSVQDGYGNTGGQGATWYNSTLINIPNPAVTNYTLSVQAEQAGGDASYVVRVHAIGPTPVAFDVPEGVNTASITNQPAGVWQYFTITVPATPLGWDLRLTNVTYSNGQEPQMYVCQGTAPSFSPAGSVYWVNHSWPSGYQWYPSSDWTGYPYDPNGQDENGWVMAVGMGNPLQAGTYLVGVINNNTGTNLISYTLASRGIGTGFSIPVTPLNFTNGPTITSTQIPRNADYYSVVVPTNTSSWRLELDTNIGNVELVINETTVPSSTPTGYPPYDVYGGLAMNRVGDQQYLMMPDSGATNIRAGTYYLAVVSEGQNPVNSTIGSNSSTYTVGSYGSLTITNIGTVDPTGNTDLLETNGLSKAGQISAYSFSVPLNTLSLEIFLTNKTGNPNMTLLTGNQLPSVSDGYGNTGGQGATWYNCTLINIPNPAVTNYTLSVQAEQGGGDASYVVRIHAIGPTPVAFDVQVQGGVNTATITNQPAGVWQYFTINVPATPLGWDLRLTNVTYSNGQEPQMYVCQGTAPSFSPAGSVYWVNHSWPSGYQWYPSSDWTGYPYDPNGQDENGWVMAVGMGNPLQAGTYLVGVINNNTGTNLISYTLASRGIGTGFSIPVTPLNFTNGIITNTVGLNPRQADYYSIVVPTNTWNWKVRLTDVSGETALVINETALPSSTPTGYPPYDVYGGFGISKLGNEQYLMLPVNAQSGSSNIVAGTYYLAVIGQGQNPVNSTIGSNSSIYILDSFGVEGITNLGPVSATDILATNAIQGGEDALYQFSIPPGWPAVEVRLDNVTASPYMTLQTGTNDVAPQGGYGYTGGVGAGWYSPTLITLPNPTVTNYSLTVQADYNNTAGAYLDADFTVHIRQMPTPGLSFDPSLNNANGNGLINTASGSLLDGQSAFYQVTVPATVNSQPVIGWKLTLSQTLGSPSVRVRPSLLPDNGSCDGTSPFSTSQAIIVPTYLTPGIWYVEVRGTGATDYTLTSSNLVLNRPAWNMEPIGGTVTTPGLSAPFFADTGIDASGNPLPGDQGSDLAQGNFDYYEIIVPPNNTGVLRTRLDAISGNPNLYLRAGAPSTLSHYSAGSCGNTLYDRSLTASAFSEYGNWVPIDGRHQAALTSGPWYLAVEATGNSNVRYRLRMDTGSISNLSLNGGSFTSQSLVSGDWLYYAAYIPTNAPVNWIVTYAVQLGNVIVHVRDTSPPGFATTINDLRDWNYDNKNHGPYPVFSSPGTYTLTTPPLRPGVTNYLGFEATSDAIFSVSCTTNGGSINYTNTLAFYGGFTTNQIPPFGQLKFRVDVPVDATEWIDTTVHSNSVWLFLDQGSAPTLTTSDDFYSENNANQGLDQSLKNLASWPWLPGYSYFLNVTNTSAITQPFSFSMFGVYPEAGPVDFISGVMLPNKGGFLLTMQVNPGWSYYLEYSTDLINWYYITSFTPATGTITYTDTSASSYPARFYRLVPQ